MSTLLRGIMQSVGSGPTDTLVGLGLGSDIPTYPGVADDVQKQIVAVYKVAIAGGWHPLPSDDTDDQHRSINARDFIHAVQLAKGVITPLMAFWMFDVAPALESQAKTWHDNQPNEPYDVQPKACWEECWGGDLGLASQASPDQIMALSAAAAAKTANCACIKQDPGGGYSAKGPGEIFKPTATKADVAPLQKPTSIAVPIAIGALALSAGLVAWKWTPIAAYLHKTLRKGK